MENRDYAVVVAECSKELSAKERIQIKDVTDAIRLDEATKESAVIIDADFYAVLNIHNEKSDDKDYNTYVVVDKNGQRYTTGSPSFWSSFMNIFEEMEGETEPWSIKVYRMPSKNRAGKDFITCSLI
jgi:precorrin-2 methylase